MINWWLFAASILIGSLTGIYGLKLAYYLTPKFPYGTPVRWRYDQTDNSPDAWSFGVYVRRTSTMHHSVRVTGPEWWTAVGAEVTCTGKELIRNDTRVSS